MRYIREYYQHIIEHYYNEARISLYLYPDRFARNAVRWYLAARIERERAKSA
jgi:hypothetical protein